MAAAISIAKVNVEKVKAKMMRPSLLDCHLKSHVPKDSNEPLILPILQGLLSWE